ncbi:MAG: HPr family phosphocarrier protein [Lachnospiraceae bacterium]|nr:HPr family phosphocarrier protein [Lachnospiraceae bacterium]
MVAKTVEVINAQGLHMRPAGVLAQAMNKHKECDVKLNVNGKSINGKAVMQIMSAGIKCGSTVEIVCDGAEEQAVLDEAVAMFESGFGE